MHVPSPFLDIAGNFPAIFTLGQLNVVGAAYCIRTTAAGRLFSFSFRQGEGRAVTMKFI